MTTSTRVATAAIVATVAFVTYSRTLLPGVDLGDTGAFQAAVLWPRTSARQAYPLYYGFAGPFVELVSAVNPARGLNLFSALAAAAVVGLLAWIVGTLTRSILAAVFAALLFAFSYTFWTQSVIAEVYTLHLAILGALMVTLLAYASRPDTIRFALCCAVYALGFGNHLSMILLLVPCAAFLLLAHPQPRELLTARMAGLALLIGAVGALQYTPNLLAVWSSIDAPPGWSGRLGAFWFDVTKSDWRATMVAGIDPGALRERALMWGWDLRQQFGTLGSLAAAAGAVRVWWVSRPWAAFLWLGYIINTAFAITYNVGDSHVFLLPGHYLTAVAAGVGAAAPFALARIAPFRAGAGAVRAALVVLIAGAAWRGWDTWPAVDRHADRRAENLVGTLLAGLDEQGALLVSRMNWEQENAVLYATRTTSREVASLRLLDVLPHFPYLVEDNHGIGRDIVLTRRAAADVIAAYGGRFPLVQDPVPVATSLSAVTGRIPRGAPYVLAVLTPLREYPHDPVDLARAVASLTAGGAPPADAHYRVVAGLAGEMPVLHLSAKRPFRQAITLLGDPFTIRMESWLPTDTFRRGGFGHVLRGRERVMFVERGVSLVWFTPEGDPQVAYAAGPYAPQPRFRIPVQDTRFAGRLTESPKSQIPSPESRTSDPNRSRPRPEHGTDAP